MAQKQDSKISTGPNSRPKNESIAQTGAGIPDDSGGLPEALEGLEADGDAASGGDGGAGPAAGERLQDTPEGSRATVDKALEQQDRRDR